MADAEVGFVELVRNVEAQALEFPPLKEDGVEPCQGKQQLAMPEGLPASTELILHHTGRISTREEIVVFAMIVKELSPYPR